MNGTHTKAQRHEEMKENEIGKVVVDCAGRLHKKQVLTYLKLTGMKLGYLLNFGDELMKDGIFSILNGNIE